jgi:hypothetical protein
MRSSLRLQRSWVRSQHPSAQWNLMGARWSSVDYSTKKRKKKLRANLAIILFNVRKYYITVCREDRSGQWCRYFYRGAGFYYNTPYPAELVADLHIFIESGSGSRLFFRLIRISNLDPDPGFWWSNLKKFYSLKKNPQFSLSSISIYLSFGLHKGLWRYRRSLQFSTENFQHFRTSFFLYFWVATFAFRDPETIRIWIPNPNPQNKRESGHLFPEVGTSERIPIAIGLSNSYRNIGLTYLSDFNYRTS